MLALSTLLSAQGLAAAEPKLLVGPEFAKERLYRVKTARKEIWIGTDVFLLRPKGKTRELAEALSHAARRGVKVKVFLEDPGRDDSLWEHNKQTGKWLKHPHVWVRFDSPKIRSHEKVAIIDPQWCFVGSHNLTESALRFNDEVSLLVRSRLLARKLKKSFNYSF